MAPKRGNKEEFHSSRESLLSSLNRTKIYIENNGVSMVASELEARLSLVESVFTQLCSVQQQIEMNSDDVSEFENRHEIEDIYCEVKSRILSQLTHRGRRSITATSPSPNSSLSTVDSRASKLPKLKLPEFNGNFTEWTSWLNTFCTLIDADGEVDDLSKFVHLKSCLGPNPLETIECLELSADNYRRALQLLKDRFENKSIIVQAHVDKLCNINKLKQPTSEDLRLLVDRVNAQLEALRSLNKDSEILEALLFHLIQDKLDDETLEKWENEFDNSQLPSWKLLAQFVINRSINMASREVRRRRSPKKINGGKRASLSTVVEASQNSCYCCSGSHNVKVCQKFASLNPLQRYFEIKKHGLCVRCFSKRHQTKDCKAQACTICNKPHHELLHRDSGNTRAQSVGDPANSTALQSALLTNRGSSYLATAVVLVEDANGKVRKCRCVLDSGSQINFVTAQFASE